MYTWDSLARTTEGMTGADLEGLCHRAALQAIRAYLDLRQAPFGKATPTPENNIESELTVSAKHFEIALANRER